MLRVLDSGLKILSAKASFYATFKVTPKETLGNFIYNLGNGQWDILRVLQRCLTLVYVDDIQIWPL